MKSEPILRCAPDFAWDKPGSHFLDVGFLEALLGDQAMAIGEEISLPRALGTFADLVLMANYRRVNSLADHPRASLELPAGTWTITSRPAFRNTNRYVCLQTDLAPTSWTDAQRYTFGRHIGFLNRKQLLATVSHDSHSACQVFLGYNGEQIVAVVIDTGDSKKTLARPIVINQMPAFGRPVSEPATTLQAAAHELEAAELYEQIESWGDTFEADVSSDVVPALKAAKFPIRARQGGRHLKGTSIVRIKCGHDGLAFESHDDLEERQRRTSLYEQARGRSATPTQN